MPDAVSMSSVLSALGWAVLHFLWQGCLIAGLAALTLAGQRERSAQARYVVGCAALACCLAAFVVTLTTTLSGAGVSPIDSTVTGAPDSGWAILIGSSAAASSSPTISSAYIPNMDEVVFLAAWLWAVGVLLMAARFAAQRTAVHRIKCDAVAEFGESTRRLFDTVCEELGVYPAVRFARSRVAEVPMVVGWLSPIVVVPVSALTSLTPDQLRAVLAHELAHIRRYDHLVNGIQSVIEVVLFFHPAVWWLSGRVRQERELCCDEIAVRAAGSPIVFAQALSRLEALRYEHSQIALAANGGSLMQRIQRIMGIEAKAGSMTVGLVVGLALVSVGLTPLLGMGVVASDFAEMEAKIQAAVASGELTQQEADAKLTYLRKHWDAEAGAWIDEGKNDKPTLAEMEAKIQAAVASGELTQEEADAKRAYLREH
jgi:beta-lactamase regulating signal transducer with metallopeptidase domain